MKTRRLVLISVFETHASPWIRANGRESEVIVRQLGEEEKVVLEVDSGAGEDNPILVLSQGSNLLSQPLAVGAKFRLSKVVGGECHTSVEVLGG